MELVRSLYRAILARDFPAVGRLLADDLIQHNPALPNGAAATVADLSAHFAAHPQATIDIRRAAASGDLVFVHAHWKQTADDRGRAVADIFRIQEGRIAEHWSLTQPVPDDATDKPMV